MPPALTAPPPARLTIALAAAVKVTEAELLAGWLSVPEKATDAVSVKEVAPAVGLTVTATTISCPPASDVKLQVTNEPAEPAAGAVQFTPALVVTSTNCRVEGN